MKVLVTDYAWDSLDPEKEILAEVGAELLVAETGQVEEFCRLAKDHQVDGILTCWSQTTAAVIDASQKLLVVSCYGIGLDNIDIAHATEVGVVVTNVPAYCLDEVSDHALGLLLACTRKIALYDRNIRAQRWDNRIGPPIPRLRGRTLGIVGFGKIGRTLAPKAGALGLSVIACDAFLDDETIRRAGAEPRTFDKLIEEADFISLHCPLTDATRHLLAASQFDRMKPTAYVINTSRGELIDIRALRDALETGRIAGAGLDVMPTEPPELDDPILQDERVVLTPHAAYVSVEAGLDLQKIAARQVAEVLTGRRPEDIVIPAVLSGGALRAKELAE